MTNIDKIRNMSEDELVSFLRRVSRTYMMQFYDLKKWLHQDSWDPVYRGKDAFYLKGLAELDDKNVQYLNTDLMKKDKPEVVPCRIVDVKKEFGRKVYWIVIDNDLFDVPEEYISFSARFYKKKSSC